MSKVDVRSWVKTLGLPRRVEIQVLEYLRLARTPQDFEGKVRGLSALLESRFRKLHENYRSNWHSTHCECDGCLKIDRKEKQTAWLER